MFTGIIEALGTVERFQADALVLKVPSVFLRIKKGGSLSVNGVCLTMAQKKARLLSFNVSPETRERSNLGRLKKGDKVNLERPLKAGTRIEGHWVLGHVDGKCRIKEVSVKKGQTSFYVRVARSFQPYLVEKGSVALDGVSLTVGKLARDGFWAHLVPYTLKNTVFKYRKSNDLLNLEIDILAKFARLKRSPRQWIDKLNTAL